MVEITKRIIRAKIDKGFSISQIAHQIGKSKTATNYHFLKNTILKHWLNNSKKKD